MRTFRLTKRRLLSFFFMLCLLASTQTDAPSVLHAQEPAPKEESSPKVSPALSTLRARYGRAATDLGTIEQTTKLRDEIQEEMVFLELDLKALKPEGLELDGAIKFLQRRIENTRLRRRDRQGLVKELAQLGAMRQAKTTKIQSLELQQGLLGDQVSLLSQHVSFLEEQKKLMAQVSKQKQEQKRLEDEQKRLEQEKARVDQENKNKEAQQNLVQIQERQRLARTQQLKELLTEQERLAKKVIELTASVPQIEEGLNKQLSLEKKSFVARRDKIAALMDQLPLKLSEQKKKSKVDPAFIDLRTERRRDREVYIEALGKESGYERALESAQDALNDAQEKLDKILSDKELGQTDLGQARIDLAQQRLQYRQLELKIAKTRYTQLQATLTLLKEELRVDNATFETLLPKISASARSDFYRLTSDQNWSDASQGFTLALHRLGSHARTRLGEGLEVLSNPLSITLWGWIGGALFRLGIIFGILWYLTQQTPKLVSKLTDYLLKRPNLSERPQVVIKFGELLRYLLLPIARWIAISQMIGYFSDILPEMRYLQWVINAAYIFRLTTITISVIVLPKALREKNNLNENINALDDPTAIEGIDVFDIEVDRAKKLVRSAKVVIWFTLLVIYIPELLVAMMGHSVISRIVYLATIWGLVVVVYVVLSTWKDEIAGGFERLAAERLPRAVQFVNDNKDKPWGVLVIAGASLYVMGRESAKFARLYILNTEWSKRVNNFVFRKKIEYQTKNREEDNLVINEEKLQLTPEYRAFFGQDPLESEPYKVDRPASREAIFEHYNYWLGFQRQGSVAFVGETGMGKTTELHDIAQEFASLLAKEAEESLQEDSEASDESQQRDEVILKITQLDRKLTTQEQALEYIAGLFGLEHLSSDRDARIEKLLDQPRHVIVIDDCHHMFLRQIGGFAALDLFLETVNLTDERHYWVLSFNKFAWLYLTRVKRREHYFGKVVWLPTWTQEELEMLITMRQMLTGCTANFNDLVVARAEGEEMAYEVVKSSRGYFRLLHEFSQGNPRVAITYWLRSLKQRENEDVIQVGLFKRPPKIKSLPDNYWFTLNAVAQHSELTSNQIAEIINVDVGFCKMALNYFMETDVITLDKQGRAKLRSTYFRQVLDTLTVSNYLYE